MNENQVPSNQTGTETTQKHKEMFILTRSICNFAISLCVEQVIIVTAVNLFAGVKSVSIDVSKEQVLVESALTSAEVQAAIESTGRRAVLKGIGASEQGEETRDRRTAARKT